MLVSCIWMWDDNNINTTLVDGAIHLSLVKIVEDVAYLLLY